MGAPADGKPRYVLDIEPVARTVTVGSADGLDINEITADRSVCSAAALVAGLPRAAPRPRRRAPVRCLARAAVSG